MAKKEVMLGVTDSPEVKNEISLLEHRAILFGFPEHAVEIEIQAKVFENGELLNVTRKMDMDEIREAFRKADDGYIDDDDRFVITDKGIAYLEEHNQST